MACFLIDFIGRTIGLYRKSLLSFMKLSILDSNRRFLDGILGSILRN